ncbi:conserved domain protein [Luminiphilus syltensis NOR5-1B]|uniref:Conserved domain protein n=1 Tax=Luminiphilus syltensis NOR5-1B TaxID=565045 RepID=B8KW39_9GAMM|nr:PEGA domain-containing protein [Luminiphilus syltensis]EED36240.1 conserved domain protein [Luminiphilus syltensis NOR5-1B]
MNSQPPDDDKPLAPGTFDPPEKSGGGDPLAAASFEPLDASEKASFKGISRLRLMGAAATLLVALVLFFLLTARSLEVVVHVVTPPDIDIEGTVVPLGDRYLIRPGEYQITVTTAGYETYKDTFTVTDDASQELEIHPAILPGLVSIVTNVAEATVLLDGEALGVAPIEQRKIAAGEHQLTITAPRYQRITETIAITGRGVAQQFGFDLLPDWATVNIETDPDTSRVLVDGEPLEPSNGHYEILSGERVVTITAPGFQDETRELIVMAQEPQDLGLIRLIPADGVIDLTTTPSGANVTVNGEFRGRTPLAISLKPDREHRVQLSKAGYQRQSRTLNVDRGTSDTLSLTLQPELGKVEFQLSPPEAELLIDGRVVGAGSQTLSLPAYEHRVEVRLPGYAPQRTKVQPRVGIKQRIDIALLTEAEARKAALRPEVTSPLGQTLVLIDPIAAPVNEFTMGASRREPGRRSNEVLHTVRLERGFYLATTETTNAQFRQFLATHDSGQIEGNTLNREHQPVAGISWQQAARFCNWLSSREGLPLFYREQQGIITGFNPSSTGYRLPTEAEWAYAARIDGEGQRRFAWGEDFPPTQAVTNVADNTSAFVTGRILNGYADGHIVSAPVASFPANHRGLYDMGGNVAEWVHNVYEIPSANAEVGIDPLGPQSGDNYTVRGASWALSRLSELRLSYRDYGQSGRDDLGFRIARYAE